MGIETNIGSLKLKSPVIAASGTFGYGEEYADLLDIQKLGGMVTKTITLKARAGNPMPRIVETPFGILNSIGLQNVGLEAFIKENAPYLKRLGIPIIASIADEKEFAELARKLDEINAIDGLELNLSCPNIGRKKEIFAHNEGMIAKIVKAVLKVTRKVVIAKLSPNVTNIALMAKAAERSGADSVSLVNTFLGMAVDVNTRMPKLANATGGLSGPCIKPLAVKMVWDVYNAVNIPIIGMGGIMTAEDALEFIIAGASCVAIGTVNFVNPNAAMEIADGVCDYMKKNRINDIRALTGSLKIRSLRS